MPSGLTLQDSKAQLFKTLGNAMRVRILERLRFGEQTVSALQADLGIEGNAISQQLAVLRTGNVVEGRKEGTSVYYRVADDNIFVILDAARAIFNNHLIRLHALADDDGPAIAPNGTHDHEPVGLTPRVQ